MQDQAIEGRVLDALKELAGVIGQTAETLWPMAVHATWAKGVCSLIAGLILVAVSVTLMVYTVRYIVSDEDGNDLGPCLIVCAVALVVAAFGVGVALIDGLSRVLAPEGFTLMKLLG